MAARYPQDIHTYLKEQHGFHLMQQDQSSMAWPVEGSPGLPLLDAIFEITREIIRDRERLAATIRHTRDELAYVARSLNETTWRKPGTPFPLYEPVMGAPESTFREQVRQIGERERHLNTLCRAIEQLPTSTWSVTA